MAHRAGAELGNMSHAWWDQVAVEHAVTVPSTLKDVYNPYGDSMIIVNKHGRRVVNEKAVYNERGTIHTAWDPSRYEYPNLVLFMMWDQAVMDKPDNDRFRWPVPLPGEPLPSFVAKADTLEALATELRRRLGTIAEFTGKPVTRALGVVKGWSLTEREAQIAGRIVEEQKSESIFGTPRHPYTRGLIDSLPRLGERARRGQQKLREISGVVPSIQGYPAGCRFNPRCSAVSDICRTTAPDVTPLPEDGLVRCHHHG